MRGINILYLHQFFALPAGSTGTRSYELARRWVAAGHSVTVICGRGDICGLPDQSSFEIEGIRVEVVGAVYSQKLGFWGRIWAFLYFMTACFFKGLGIRNADVVYATSTPLTIGIPAMLLKWCRRIPFVFEVRDQWPEIPIAMGYIRNPLLKKLLLCLERRIYISSSAVVALSPGMADGIRQVLGNVERPIQIAPNSADIDLFRPDMDGSAVRQQMGWQDKFIVMHFGTMGHVNGLDFLIRAAARCTDYPDILFVLIGSGRRKELLAKSAESLKLKNIVFIDNKPKLELPLWVAACDISTVILADYPILEHNSANKFFDSLAAGKPVLLNYSGWQKEILESRNAGLGCRLCSLDEYVANLLTLYKNKDQLKRMGQNGRMLAQNEFNRNKIASDILRLIQGIV